MVRTKEGENERRLTDHMTDPVKISVVEEAELVDRMVNFMSPVEDKVDQTTKVIHSTTLPWFVRECCKNHMTGEDVWLLDGG